MGLLCMMVWLEMFTGLKRLFKASPKVKDDTEEEMTALEQEAERLNTTQHFAEHSKVMRKIKQLKKQKKKASFSSKKHLLKWIILKCLPFVLVGIFACFCPWNFDLKLRNSSHVL